MVPTRHDPEASVEAQEAETGPQELMWDRERGGEGCELTAGCTQGSRGPWALAFLKLLCGESLPLSLSQ